MTQFRKKPVVIEAWQVHPNDGMTRPLPPKWLLDPMIAGTRAGAQEVGDVTVRDDGDGLDIHTLEGVMHARTGDWIIRGVKGELYPCKPDIFAATYEAATQAVSPPAGMTQPVAWMHDGENRLDICHDTIKRLLIDAKCGKQVQHYTIPLYAAPSIERELRDRGGSTVSEGAADNELPGMWQRSDFEGGQDEVRGPDWKRPAGVDSTRGASDGS